MHFALVFHLCERERPRGSKENGIKCVWVTEDDTIRSFFFSPFYSRSCPSSVSAKFYEVTSSNSSNAPLSPPVRLLLFFSFFAIALYLNGSFFQLPLLSFFLSLSLSLSSPLNSRVRALFPSSLTYNFHTKLHKLKINPHPCHPWM